MNRTFAAALLVTAAVGGLLMANPPVDLQATTPGVAQTGNVNVSGTVLAGTLTANNAGGTAAAVQGNATGASGANFGGLFKSSSTGGTGVRGVALGTSGTTNGGTFQAASPVGAGARGFHTATSGAGFGLFGQSASSEGVGVKGIATAGSGTTVGVFGSAASPNGFGVFCEGNLNATGILSGNGSGLTGVNAATLGGVGEDTFFRKTGGTVSGSTIFNKQVKVNTDLGVTTLRLNEGGVFSNSVLSGAVLEVGSGQNGKIIGKVTDGRTFSFFARNDDNVLGFASVAMIPTGTTGSLRLRTKGSADTDPLTRLTVTSAGNVGIGTATPSSKLQVVGSFAASSKNFLIDHPDDPENQYLRHSCVESDEMKNFYDGEIELDANGQAWITLPGWFESLNTKFRYGLTALDQPMPGLYVARRIRAGRFLIAGGKPGGSVSWSVTGVRKDAFALANPMKVEEHKQGRDRGAYLHPEVYGKPAQMAIGYEVSEFAGKAKNP